MMDIEEFNSMLSRVGMRYFNKIQRENDNQARYKRLFKYFVHRRI